MTLSINATAIEQPSRALDQNLAGAGAVSGNTPAGQPEQAEAAPQSATQTDTVELSADANRVQASEETGEATNEQPRAEATEEAPRNPEAPPEEGSLDVTA